MRDMFKYQFPLSPILLHVNLYLQAEAPEKVHHATVSANAEPRIIITRDESLRRENLPNEGLPEL